MEIETLAVHAGRRVDRSTGAVTPPIHLSTTFERSEAGEYPLGFSYSREDNPNRRMLEECLAALEGGKESLVLSSGLAGLTAILQALEVTYVEMQNLDAVRAAIRPNTRLVWVETPSNPLLKITDLKAVAEIARK